MFVHAGAGHVDVMFLGDSITQGWEGGGRKPWQEYMEPLHAANFGIGGDQTQHVLWRITEGHELQGIHPKVAVVMIGTNNLGSNTDGQIVAGIEKIVKTLHEKRPHMQILLLGVSHGAPRRRTRPANGSRILTSKSAR